MAPDAPLWSTAFAGLECRAALLDDFKQQARRPETGSSLRLAAERGQLCMRTTERCKDGGGRR